MNNRKIKEIIKFNVEKNIQNKWFVILNVVMFIIIFAAINWQNITSFLKDKNINISGNDEAIIQIVDKDNIFYKDFLNECSSMQNIKIEEINENSYSTENIPEDNVVLVEVSKDVNKVISAKIISREGIDEELYNLIYNGLANSRSKVFAQENNISLEKLNILNEELKIDRQMLGVDAENSESKEKIKVISIVVVYMVLIIVLSRIANEIAQEKVSKSIEYVLTSVSEKEYLLAKVLSSTITILIQMLYTFVYYIVANMISNLATIKSIETVNTFSMGAIDSTIVGYVIAMCAYLLFTVFLTTLIQAALSSKTTSVAEAGNTTMLLLMVIFTLYFISIGVINPYTKVTTFMYIISCLPIVSTFFIPAMIIIGQATTLQIIISFVLLIASVPIIFNACSKYFKNGILDYVPNKKKMFRKKEMGIKEKQDYDLRKSKCKKFAFMIGMAMILMIFLETILSLVFNIVLKSYFVNTINAESLLIIENSLILIFTLGITTAYIKFYSEDFKQTNEKVDTKSKIEIIFIGIFFITVIQVFLSIIYPKLGLDYNVFEKVNFNAGNSAFSKLIFFVGIAAVPAIFEELLFRKAILNVSKRFGNVFAICFSAMLFALYHMNINQAVFAFLIGILFGIISVRTGSIKLTILLHFLNNGYAALASIIEANSVGYIVINSVVIISTIIGGILMLKNLPKLKALKREDFKINKDCKFLLNNYTFILSMVLMIVFLWSTENILRIM